MKKFLFLLLICTCLIEAESFAQFSRYIVQLKYKGPSSYTIADPSPFLTQRSIDRRTRYHIAMDSSDLPVNKDYIENIRLSGNVTIVSVSKWLNEVCIQTTDADALATINSFSFVTDVPAIAARPARGSQAPNEETKLADFPLPSHRPLAPQGVNDYYNYGESSSQISIHNGEFLHNHGFRGEGMILAMMDAGFYNYENLPTFDSIRMNNQVLGTWDFVANEASVNEDHPHGMNCLSTIAANMPGIFMGSAPKTSFYLYRTEDISSEYPIEEHNWAVAAEKADSLGVDVFSCSLGYTTFSNSIFDLTYADLDGNTTIMARAIDIAAKKGILVVTAIGNDGNNSWHYLSTPADADSTLTVGAVNVNGETGSFSSYGPSGDGQIKPDVAAVGWGAVIANQTTGQPSFNNGTSFACPIMAGMATCLWQAFPEVNNMSIINALRQSANRAANPDNRTGYGIPDVKKAFVSLLKQTSTQHFSRTDCKAFLDWSIKCSAGMSFIVERKLQADAEYTVMATKNAADTFSLQDFSYSDDLTILTTPGSIDYRIRMVIGSDTSFFLIPTTISNTEQCTPIEEGIFIGPNPVRDNITVLVNHPYPATVGIAVFATSGQKVYTSSFNQETLSQTYSIPMQKMSRGTYYIAIYFNGKRQMIKKIIR